MAEAKDPEISALLHEDRVFDPPSQFHPRANIRDTTPYQDADRDYEAFWAQFASELEWSRKWTKVLDWTNPPHAKWFVDGQINAAVNCVDRHIRTARRNKAAIIWEGEPGDEHVQPEIVGIGGRAH